MSAIPERPVMSVRYTGDNVEEVKAFCEAKRIFVADDSDKTLFIEGLGTVTKGQFVVYGNTDGSGWYKYSVQSWKAFPRIVNDDVPVFLNEEYSEWELKHQVQCRYSVDGKCANAEVKCKCETCSGTGCDAAKCKPFQNSILRRKDAWTNHLKKYRFKTKSINDYRPLRDMKDIQMPWWCTGTNKEFAIIVCYLPVSADLTTYWDDAYEIEISDAVGIEYSERFPKPEWID